MCAEQASEAVSFRSVQLNGIFPTFKVEGTHMVDRQNPTIIPILVEDLRLDRTNPRVPETFSEREALKALVLDQKNKFVSLASHIAEDGLNPGEFPWVIGPDESDRYTVVEGNRRVAAVKLLP